MQKIKIAYFGSPSFSGTFLEKIINDKNLSIEVMLVVTQPDMPVGRKQILTPTPVKQMAEKYQLSIINSQSIINSSMINENPKINHSLASLELRRSGLKIENLKLKIKDCDLALVYAYGEILPKEILDLPKFGFWNIHPSLLPKYRGASPIAYPLILGDKKTGVSLILMDEKMDHGLIIAQEKLEIKSEDSRPDLENKLTDLAFKMIKDLLFKLSEDTCFEATWEVRNPTLRRMNTPTGAKKHGIELNQQNHSQATYTSILKKFDGFIPLPILKKAINNGPLEFTDLPKFIQKYLIKYPNYQLSMINQVSIINDQYQKPIENCPPAGGLKIENSSKLLFNLFRGLSPWPGLWTLIKIGDVEKRLKIIHLTMKQFNHVKRGYRNLTIDLVQLEGKNPVDFTTFDKVYNIFP